MPAEPSSAPSTAPPKPATSSEQPPAPAEQTGAGASPGQAEQPGGAAPEELDTLLERFGDALFQHPRVAGRIGHLAQQAAARERQRLEGEQAARAAEEAERRLVEEAERDPYEFSRKWLGEKGQERAKRELEEQLRGVREQAAKDLLEQIGRGYGDLPEWKELKPEELQAIANEVAGKSDAEFLAAFNRRAVDVIANKRVAKRTQQEIDREVEARLREREARRLSDEAGPDLAKPRTVPDRPDIRAMSDADFDRLWKTQFKR